MGKGIDKRVKYIKIFSVLFIWEKWKLKLFLEINFFFIRLVDSVNEVDEMLFVGKFLVSVCFLDIRVVW